MRRAADQLMKALADVTVGSVIVLFHLALAERESSRSPKRPHDGDAVEIHRKARSDAFAP
jgi:hypothetical protein